VWAGASPDIHGQRSVPVCAPGLDAVVDAVEVGFLEVAPVCDALGLAPEPGLGHAPVVLRQHHMRRRRREGGGQKERRKQLELSWMGAGLCGARSSFKKNRGLG